MNNKKGHWYDRLWIWSILFFALGFFNIMFAWLGMLVFMIPLLIAIFGGNKWFCNHLCGRGQLFALLGGKFKLSRGKATPKWLASRTFRYIFLAFFMLMFINIIFQTYLVASGGNDLRESIKLLWTVRVPWGWTYSPGVFPGWAAQFAFGFYGLMLTSAIIGIAVMALYKPRSWCAFCPMGTMTQAICKARNGRSSKREDKRSI